MKNIKPLILIISSLILCGCSGGKNTQPVTSESSSSSSSDTGNIPTTGSTTVTPSTTGGSIPTFEGKTYTAVTSGDAWEDSFKSGTQFDTSTNINSLISYLNVGSGLISSIECVKAKSTNYGTKSESIALAIGTASADGSMLFTFAKPVSKVVVDAESYFKTFDYDPYSSYDPKSEITIGTKDEELVTLQLHTTDSQIRRTITCEFPYGSTSLLLKGVSQDKYSESGRVMIQSFEFSY